MDPVSGTWLAPVAEWDKSAPPEGEFLLLIEPQRIPPHLALLARGSYFSLSVKGVELEQDPSRFFSLIDRKKKELLFLPVTPPLEAPDPLEAFLPYKGQGPPHYTCLSPLADRFLVEHEQVETVHGLIEQLDGKGLLERPFLQRNTTEGDRDGLWIPPYHGNDVRMYLRNHFRKTQ
ncbi:MAG: hypothetical protein ABEH38_06925 [Flavobacteriales bacterium]